MDQTSKRFPFSRGIQITMMMLNLEYMFEDIADCCELLLLLLNRNIHLVFLEADSETLARNFLKAAARLLEYCFLIDTLI